jgi:hypothetical protein
MMFADMMFWLLITVFVMFGFYELMLMGGEDEETF